MSRFLLIVSLALIAFVACEDQGTTPAPGKGEPGTPADGNTTSGATAPGQEPAPGDGTDAPVGTTDPVPTPGGDPIADGVVGDGAPTPATPPMRPISLPIAEGKSAYDLAGKKELPKTKAGNYDGLLNVYRLSENIISGSEPHGEAALKRLADMGVKTILSVDGKTPDVAAAKKLGMRYVHVPIQYRGITESERLKIARTFLELDGPFYVHCFHGIHRGPAAAAWGRVVLDGVARREALAEMRQWCGTSDKYRGLYQAVGKSPAPTAAQLAALDFDFPGQHEFKGFRGAMVEISRAYDHLKALKKAKWKTDPDHPDLLAVNEARRLVQAFAAAGKLPEVAAKPEEFRKWNAKSLEWSEKLVKRLDRVANGEKDAREPASEAFRMVAERCDKCHTAYRNKRVKK